MKKINSKCYWLCFSSLLTSLLVTAQVKDQPAQGFEIISRQSIAGNKTGRIVLAGGNITAGYTTETRDGKAMYNVQADGMQASVPALSSMELAANAGRIWVYGDSVNRHVVENIYANVYSGSGALVKSLGKIGQQPYTVAIAGNGALAFAGHSGKDSGKLPLILSMYDLNGNRLWQNSLPDALPTRIFLAPDSRHTAVVLYTSHVNRSRIQFYDASGKLLFTHHGSTTGLEFLSSNKVVICNGNVWAVYDLSAGFKQLLTGSLPGTTIGRYPVVAHPSKDIFFVLTVNGTGKGISLQGYDAGTGAMLAQSGFEGKGYWQPYRLVEVVRDGNLQLRTETEVITLRMQ
jgi:hypothetical protein